MAAGIVNVTMAARTSDAIRGKHPRWLDSVPVLRGYARFMFGEAFLFVWGIFAFAMGAYVTGYVVWRLLR